VTAADGAISAYTAQRNDIGTELGAVSRDLAVVEAELGQVCHDLAHGVLTTSDADAVSALAEEFGALQLATRREELAKASAVKQVRLDDIEGDELFQSQDRLEPIRAEMAALREREIGIASELHRFSFDEFRESYEMKDVPKPVCGWFVQFLRWLFFVSYFKARREEHREQWILTTLPCDTLAQCYARYDELCSDRDRVRRESDERVQLSNSISAIVEEHERLQKEIAAFDGKCLTELREILERHIHSCDYRELRGLVRKEAKVLLSKCLVLQKKAEYLRNLATFLHKEQRDRQGRIDSIGRVRGKWRRKPYNHLRGDTERKRVWLEDLPRQKAAATAKRLRFARGMHANFYGFDDYCLIDAMLEDEVEWLMYDLFAHCGEEDMPYEGFARDVVDEIEDWRVEHDEEKADYAAFGDYIEDGDDGDLADDDSAGASDSDDAGAAAAAVAVVAIAEAEDVFSADDADDAADDFEDMS